MQFPIEVRFLDEANILRAGELVNPRTVDNGNVFIEFAGDHEVDVYVFRSNGEEHIFRTHISRVASMREVAYA